MVIVLLIIIVVGIVGVVAFLRLETATPKGEVLDADDFEIIEINS